jgi:hypothetical protein
VRVSASAVHGRGGEGLQGSRELIYSYGDTFDLGVRRRDQPAVPPGERESCVSGYGTTSRVAFASGRPRRTA